jgi:hypothetical protein
MTHPGANDRGDRRDTADLRRQLRYVGNIMSESCVAREHFIRPLGNAASEVMKAKVGWRDLTSLSSAVMSSHPSRSANAT